MTVKSRIQARPRGQRAPSLVVKVMGPSIRSGRIPVPELLAVCQHTQSAVSRQAEALEGKQTVHPGRKSGRVEHECTLELVSLGPGSAVLAFEQAKPQPNLPMYGGPSNLGEEAVVGVASAVKALATDVATEIDLGVLQSLGSLSDVIGRRVRRIEIRVPSAPGRRSIRATIDKKVQGRILRRLEPLPRRPLTVDGVLEMVDFKPNDYRCRIHPSVGAPIACTFSAAVEEAVFNSLRRHVRVAGVATQNRHTGRTESLSIESVTPLDPLRANPERFFNGVSFDDLVRDQAVDPLSSVRDLEGLWRDDGDVDAFVDEVYRRRA